MSSVGVFEKKKSKCPKENFQSVKRGKCLSIEFRVFGKKMKERKKRFWGEDVWVEFFLLSSCSLVRLYVNLQVKVTEKKNGNFQSILRVGVCALHTLGRHVVKHG
jgi:hypothetical protein